MKFNQAKLFGILLYEDPCVTLSTPWLVDIVNSINHLHVPGTLHIEELIIE